MGALSFFPLFHFLLFDACALGNVFRDTIKTREAATRESAVSAEDASERNFSSLLLRKLVKHFNLESLSGGEGDSLPGHFT